MECVACMGELKNENKTVLEKSEGN